MQIRAIKGRVLAYDADRCCVYRRDDLNNELQDSMRPNARGKGRPHGLAEASNDVGVPLTEKLGWGEKEQLMRTSGVCLDGE